MQVTLKAKQVKDSVTYTPGVCFWKWLGLGDGCAFQSLLCREIFATLPCFEKKELLGILREHFHLATSFWMYSFLIPFIVGFGHLFSLLSLFPSVWEFSSTSCRSDKPQLAKLITLMIKWMPRFLSFFLSCQSRRAFCPFCTILRTFNLWAVPSCLWDVLLFQSCNSSVSNRYHSALGA